MGGGIGYEALTLRGERSKENLILQRFVGYATIRIGAIVLRGCWPFILHRWEVVLMNLDFKDLMAFGMFIIALLTFIFNNRK